MRHAFPGGGLACLAMTVARAAALALPVERFSVAPMMEYTDRHFRHMFRLLSRRAVLYTEMVAANTLVDDGGRPRHRDPGRWLAFDDAERRTMLQLGGAAPGPLAAAAALGAPYGYAGVNLNCGCPSDRVAGSGCFGAAMMRDARKVADCCAALGAVLPVSVKCRVGVAERVADMVDDDEVLYADLARFVDAVAAAGVRRFAVHARVAVLAGLSPDANRKVPPLKPHLVARLAGDFPELEVVTNGEVASYGDVAERSAGLEGAMVGRDACRRPWYYANVDTAVYGDPADPAASRRGLLAAYADYAAAFEGSTDDKRDRRRALVKPCLALFHGDAGTGAFKREVDAALRDPSATARDVLDRAAARVPDAVLDAPPAAAPPEVAPPAAAAAA